MTGLTVQRPKLPLISISLVNRNHFLRCFHQCLKYNNLREETRVQNWIEFSTSVKDTGSIVKNINK